MSMFFYLLCPFGVGFILNESTRKVSFFLNKIFVMLCKLILTLMTCAGASSNHSHFDISNILRTPIFHLSYINRSFKN